MKSKLESKLAQLRQDLANTNQQGGMLQSQLNQTIQKSQALAGAIEVCEQLLAEESEPNANSN